METVAEYRVARRVARAVQVAPAAEGPPRCIECGRELRRDEIWQVQSSPDGEYSVGVHDECRVRAPGGGR